MLPQPEEAESRSGPSWSSSKKALPKMPMVHSLTEAASPANMKVYLRGNPATPGDEAPRRFLAILAGGNRPLFAQGSGRLELARGHRQQGQPADGPRHGQPRLAASLRPGPRRARRATSARSASGRRIRSCSTTWPAASSPSGWSLKALHREIMLSATYQLSSRRDDRQRRASTPTTGSCGG